MRFALLGSLEELSVESEVVPEKAALLGLLGMC